MRTLGTPALAARATALVAATAIVCRLAGLGVTWLPPTMLLVLLLGVSHATEWFLRERSRVPLRALAREHAFVLAVAALVVLTLVVRLSNLTSDLGHVPLDIDENRLAANIKLYFVTGALGHETVEHYPGLAFWLFAGAAFLRFVRGLGAGLVTTPAHLSVAEFVAAARIANVFVAMGIVALTACIGRRIAGTWGLLAALLVAIVPLSIDTTTVCRCDPVMVLAVLGAVQLSLVALDRTGSAWFIAAGAVAGIATGVKYSGVFALGPVLVATLAFVSWRDRLKAGMQACAAFVAAIAITNHFIWYDFPNFLIQLTLQVAITGRGHWAATDNPAGFYMMILDRFGPGVGLMALAGAFAAYTLSTRRKDRWTFVSFPLWYLAVMASRPSQFPRWVFPLLPFATIAAVAAIGQAYGAIASRDARRIRAWRAITVVAVVTLMAQPLWAGIVSASRRLATPTHVLAERWITEHVAPGATVIVERGWLVLDGTPVQVRRVDDLKKTLDGGLAMLAGAQWVVVPEPDYGHPLLQSLSLYDRIHGEPRLGSGTGYDYSFYAVPQR